jgi:hypothetical protein
MRNIIRLEIMKYDIRTAMLRNAGSRRSLDMALLPTWFKAKRPATKAKWLAKSVLLVEWLEVLEERIEELDPGNICFFSSDGIMF